MVFKAMNKSCYLTFGGDVKVAMILYDTPERCP